MKSCSSSYSIKSLSVEYRTGEATAIAIQNVSVDLKRGETLGMVGESGSGKSTLGFAVMGLIRPPGYITNGKITFDDTELLTLRSEQLRELRGRRLL